MPANNGSPLVSAQTRGDVSVITINNPPMNALSFAVSAELIRAIEAAEADAGVKAVVFTGAGANFSAGADINDFNREPSPEDKNVRDVIAAVEHGKKTYVAAIEGVALGGGLELALACDYRIASKKAKVGLPEIKLGLLPGAGGTQRLPRLIGAHAALEVMLKGENHAAEKAKELGILDQVVESDVVDAAVTTAELALKTEPKRRLSARKATIAKGIGAFALPFVVAQAHKMVPAEENGGFAAHKLIDAVEASIGMDFNRGIAREARLFEELVRSAPSAALRHIFFAERELSKIPGLPAAAPLEIKSAGVIGAGTMGTGIAITFAQAGIPVTIIEPKDEQIERAKTMIFGMFSHQVQKGRMTQEKAWQLGQSIEFESDFSALKDADVVIEAVFENMDIKKDVFKKLDAVCKPEAILASNTSTLDIDEMAAITKRADRFVGLHFFAPANIMKLLEIVRGKATSAQTLVSAIKLGKTLRKVAVVSGNAFGFIGNRMLFDYAREAQLLALEGVEPARIDKVMKNFGMAMGPFAMFDLSGIDVFWHIQNDRPASLGARSSVIDRLYDMKRHGQKTGAGFYKYEKGNREPIPDPEVVALIAEEAHKLGIKPRPIDDKEIIKRLVCALINVGANLLAEGVALRPSDEDIVYIYGYGFPPHKGGPLCYADSIGLEKILADIERFKSEYGPHWEPSPLLVQLAKSGSTFATYQSKELVHA